jgi:hypothetical protein
MSVGTCGYIFVMNDYTHWKLSDLSECDITLIWLVEHANYFLWGFQSIIPIVMKKVVPSRDIMTKSDIYAVMHILKDHFMYWDIEFFYVGIFSVYFSWYFQEADTHLQIVYECVHKETYIFLYFSYKLDSSVN